MKKNILVACGGLSSEHDVSVITALQFLEKIDTNKYNCEILYLSRQNKMYTSKYLKSFDAYRQFDCNKHKRVTLMSGDNRLFWVKKRGLAPLFAVDFVINCCHGGVGENGILSGLFELSGIDGSSPISASMGICMDKVLSKMVAENAGINVVDYVVIDEFSWKYSREVVEKQVNNLGYPVVVKPSRQGSSVGVVLVNSKEDLVFAMNLAFEYDNKLVVEKAIINKREFNCSCLLSEEEILVSEIEEPNTSGVILSFEQKYSGGGKGKMSVTKGIPTGMEALSRQLPANITAKLKKRLQVESKKIYSLFELCGVVRIDYIFDVDNKKLYFSEVNVIPGSMATYFWENINIFDTLIAGSKKYWASRRVLKNDYAVSLLSKK